MRTPRAASIWDLRARFHDLFDASDLRRGPDKAALFQEMQGRVLFLAVGTGVDIRWFPEGLEIIAIDISEEMLRRADARRQAYRKRLALVRADALSLCFPDESFDTVATSCTLCSVSDPPRALTEICRVLRPGGRLLMFEHVKSHSRVLGFALDLMALCNRRGGTEMNRDTVGSVARAGFRITHVESVFLDIILAIRAVKEQECRPDSLHGHATTPGDERTMVCDGIGDLPSMKRQDFNPSAISHQRCFEGVHAPWR